MKLVLAVRRWPTLLCYSPYPQRTTTTNASKVAWIPPAPMLAKNYSGRNWPYDTRCTLLLLELKGRWFFVWKVYVNALVRAPFIIDPSAFPDDVYSPWSTPGHTTEAHSPYKFSAPSSTSVPTSLETDLGPLKTVHCSMPRSSRVFARAVRSHYRRWLNKVTLPPIQVSQLRTVACIRVK